MNQNQLLDSLIKFADHMDDIDKEGLKTALDCFLNVKQMSDSMQTLTEVVSNNPRGRFNILRALYLEPQGFLRPADLAEAGEMTRASATHNIDVLEKNGMVIRQIDSENRRSIKVSLTDKGREIMSKALPDYLRTIGKVVNRIPLSLTNQVTENLNILHSEVKKIIEELSTDKN